MSETPSAFHNAAVAGPDFVVVVVGDVVVGDVTGGLCRFSRYSAPAAAPAATTPTPRPARRKVRRLDFEPFVNESRGKGAEGSLTVSLLHRTPACEHDSTSG